MTTSSNVLSSLYKKLATASASISTIEKLGENKEQKYSYATDADVSHAVRKACIEAGLFVGMRSASRVCPPDEIVSKHGTKGLREYVQVVVVFVDAETGTEHPVCSIGTGQDYGDKAMAKGITSAVKYALLKGLSLPTGDDPEADAETDRNPGVATPKPVAAVAAAPVSRPDHHALKVFLQGNGIPRETFERVCVSGLKRQPGTKITDLNPTQVATVTRLLQAELDGPGDDLDEAVEAAL